LEQVLTCFIIHSRLFSEEEILHLEPVTVGLD